MTLKQLRSRAIAHSLFAPSGLADALASMGFVQADPIRSPARAQDLILRQRVEGYKMDDLEKSYPELEIEEDFLYAYGFISRQLNQALHPRPRVRISALEKRIVAFIQANGATHPRELSKQLQGKSVINAWGGYSKATKHALEKLHHHGHLRVSRRENGIRIYEVSKLTANGHDKDSRFRTLLLAILNISGPCSARFLLAELSHLKYLAKTPADRRRQLDPLLQDQTIESGLVDGIEYLWIPNSGDHPARSTRQTRILAPFDPLVRDRERFEHLWNWTYRFEAYTPAAKRQRGYYAMPVLWLDRMIGWANARVVDNTLEVEFGYVQKRPSEHDFKEQAEAEVSRLAAFLGLDPGNLRIQFGV